ncbi:porin family protein [Bacteroides sp.]|uniref:porin family protein n=1 Tax=Bacteroides sp. TaxID=29523 RepID=UPI002FCACC26
MKKLTLSLLMLCGSLCCFSQVKLKVQAGVGLTSITKSEDYKPNIGYRIGVGLEVPIDNMWSFQSTLFFLNKSFSFDKYIYQVLPPASGYYGIYNLSDSKINALYLQLPLQIAVRIPFHSQFGMQLSAGPYIAYGIGGKSWTRFAFILREQIYKDPSQSVPINDLKRDKTDTFSDDGLKRFDLGLTLGLNFVYKRLFAGVGFEYGLMPIATNMPKSPLAYRIGMDKTEVSPHHLGFNTCIGFSF